RNEVAGQRHRLLAKQLPDIDVSDGPCLRDHPGVDTREAGMCVRGSIRAVPGVAKTVPGRPDNIRGEIPET
ncbi:MAG TPA: hypothetical protein VF170_12905, partial [Planctomycetaceae bacterium]